MGVSSSRADSPLVSQAPPIFQSRSPGLHRSPSRPMAADDRKVAYQKLAEEKERLSGQMRAAAQGLLRLGIEPVLIISQVVDTLIQSSIPVLGRAVKAPAQAFIQSPDNAAVNVLVKGSTEGPAETLVQALAKSPVKAATSAPTKAPIEAPPKAHPKAPAAATQVKQVEIIQDKQVDNSQAEYDDFASSDSDLEPVHSGQDHKPTDNQEGKHILTQEQIDEWEAMIEQAVTANLPVPPPKGVVVSSVGPSGKPSSSTAKPHPTQTKVSPIYPAPSSISGLDSDSSFLNVAHRSIRQPRQKAGEKPPVKPSDKRLSTSKPPKKPVSKTRSPLLRPTGENSNAVKGTASKGTVSDKPSALKLAPKTPPRKRRPTSVTTPQSSFSPVSDTKSHKRKLGQDGIVYNDQGFWQESPESRKKAKKNKQRGR